MNTQQSPLMQSAAARDTRAVDLACVDRATFVACQMAAFMHALLQTHVIW